MKFAAGRQSTGADDEKRRRRLRWYIALAAVGVVLLVAAAGYATVRLTSSSSYCTSCHQMKAAGASWKQSAHAKVSCVSCHVEPGLVNGTVWRFEEAKNIVGSYLNVPSTMAARVQAPTDAACLQCHELSAIPTVIDNVRMPHESHVQMHNLHCIDCHTRTGHIPASQATSVSMSECFMCHNGTTAPNTCLTCHVTAPTANVHPPNWLKAHGRAASQDPSECLRCHHDEKAFCDACHSIPTPAHFSGTWLYTHGKAATADEAGCLGCHNYQAFCAQCHQVDHPADWVATHGAVASKGYTSCLVCHPRSMCDQCHGRGTVKPL